MSPLAQKILTRWLPLFLWLGLIFFLSSIPNLRSGLPGTYDFILRKLFHAFEFGVLAWLLLRLLAENRRRLSSAPIWSGALAVLYAISDELHQGFIPGRQASFPDVLIDTLGILLAIIILRAHPIFLLFDKNQPAP